MLLGLVISVPAGFAACPSFPVVRVGCAAAVAVASPPTLAAQRRNYVPIEKHSYLRVRGRVAAL